MQQRPRYILNLNLSFQASKIQIKHYSRLTSDWVWPQWAHWPLWVKTGDVPPLNSIYMYLAKSWYRLKVSYVYYGWFFLSLGWKIKSHCSTNQCSWWQTLFRFDINNVYSPRLDEHFAPLTSSCLIIISFSRWQLNNINELNMVKKNCCWMERSNWGSF